MKIDRGNLIAGQKLKVVREILRDLGRRDSFSTKAVQEHLQKQWWWNYIDELIEHGQIPKDARSIFRSGWEYMTKQKTIYGKIPVRKMPDQSVAAKNLVDQLLTDGIIEQKRGLQGHAPLRADNERQRIDHDAVYITHKSRQSGQNIC